MTTCESVALVAVTVAVNVFAFVPIHDSLEVPEPPVIEVEPRVQERSFELVETARTTVPPKPLTGIMEIVELPAMLTLLETFVGLAAVLKSLTLYVTPAEWLGRPRLVPVTVAR